MAGSKVKRYFRHLIHSGSSKVDVLNSIVTKVKGPDTPSLNNSALNVRSERAVTTETPVASSEPVRSITESPSVQHTSPNVDETAEHTTSSITASGLLSPPITDLDRRLETLDLVLSTTHEQYGIIPGITIRASTFPSDTAQGQPSPTNADGTAEEEEVAIMLPLANPLPRRKSTKSLVSHDEAHVIFPREISCYLTVTFNEVQKFDEAVRLEGFVWYEAQSYEKIKKTIIKIKETFQEKGITKPAHHVYLRYASCFVKGSRNQSSRGSEESILIDSDDILPDAAIRAICGFIHHYPFQRFALKVHCDYSSIHESLQPDFRDESLPPNEPSLHQAIQNVYKEKMNVGQPTIKKQKYLSYADQQVLIHPKNSCRIIDEDVLSYPRLTENQKRELKVEVERRPASILQAACVYNAIPMRFLYHFLCEAPHAEQEHADDPETLKLNAPNTCEGDLCAKYHEGLADCIHKFIPETIRFDSEHSVKDDRAVIPVRYVDKSTTLGDGAFGKVYEVNIDPHYQLLSPDITRTYALKEISTDPSYRDGFDREIKMLLYLARYLPHEHILTHITSWKQEDTYYILYEKAHSNLRQHMETYDGGDLSPEQITWFFEQLRGLSDAIRRIHFFHEPDVDPITGLVKAKKTGVVGRHHDIKPENILAFDLPRERPTLKLSDFGAGKFSHVKAQNESAKPASRVRGAQTYAGPESHKSMRKSMTRPFDMWALGCVFLELLLWFLGIKRPDGRRTFADMRLDPDNNTGILYGYDYFWQRNADGRFKVNDAASWVLDQLQVRLCKDMPPFQELITLIRQLLVIQPEERPSAVKLFNSLDAILVKLQVELKMPAQQYSQQYNANKKLRSDVQEAVPSPRPSTNLAPVGRLDEDVSTTGESRVESAANLQKLSEAAAAAAASQPPIQGGTTASVQETGRQFEANSPSHRDEDEGDAFFMGGPVRPRPSLEQEVNTGARALEGEK